MPSVKRNSMLLLSIALATSHLESQERIKAPMSQHVFYRTVKVDGLSIFYREAGPKDAPTLLLLHGLPSSSRMFEPLFARLSDRYHLIAPDYPGFGHSDWPDPKKFAYTFDHISEVVNHFTEALGLSRYTLYMQDYGGPVGFRMALAHPDRIEALIVQDAVAHNEGLGRIGRRGGPFGPIALPTKVRFAPTCCRLPPRGRGMPEMIRTWNAMIRTSGPMNLPFSASPGRRTFKATCSTTIAPTWRPTRNGRPGCVKSSRASWSSGGSMSPRLTPRSRKPTPEMCRRLKFTLSTAVISHWTRLPMRSPHWSGASSVLHVEERRMVYSAWPNRFSSWTR